MKWKVLFAESYLLSILCMLSFALVALWIGDHQIAEFDDRWIDLIQGWENDTLTPIMKLFTSIGAGIPVVILTLAFMGFLYVVFHHRNELLFFAGVVIGSALLNMVLKLIFHRARPTLHRIVDANGYSFPSGHSMGAFTLYGVLCFLLWKHAGPLYLRMMIIAAGIAIVLLIGISRIYLGVHYPSDVIGGYLASGTWLTASIWFYQRRMERK